MAGRYPLSKSRLMALRQCSLRLWNEIHRYRERRPPTEAERARFAQGHEVGDLARERWPGGRLVDAPHTAHEKAMAQTLEALNDAAVPALYEAAFAARGTRIRADVLVRLGRDRWALWEVKSTSKLKPIHRLDFAVQLEVIRAWAEQAAFPLEVVEGGVLHLNGNYLYPGGEYDLEQLFATSPLLGGLEMHRGEVEDLFERGLEIAGLLQPPEVPPGPHCQIPYACPFLGTTCVVPPRDELTLLPGVGAQRVQQWRAEGIERLIDLDPADDGLNPLQERVLRAHVTGKPQVEPGLAEALEGLPLPRYHLDFETVAPALPLWEGTRPFQQIPFQFSLHLEGAGGGVLSHSGYLHEGTDDPRRPLALALLDQLEGVQAPVLVYSPFEARIIRELADHLPDLGPRLQELLPRLVDLLPLVKQHFYDPAFEGGFSIKQVLPAVVEGVDYSDLKVQDGEAASRSYLRLVTLQKEGQDPEELSSLRRDLWLYCQRDTEAMVALTRALHALGGSAED